MRANQFETFIVTGGGRDFVCACSQKIYGIPTRSVIGSSLDTKYEFEDGKAELIRRQEFFFNNNFDDKPIGIDTVIGKRPLAAFSNSTGDRQMLEYTKAGTRSARHQGRHLHAGAVRRGNEKRLARDQHEE